MHRFLTIVIALLGCLLPLHAQLSFDRTGYAEETEPKQKTVEATYSFKNTGDYTIKIEDIRTSCGCTTTKLRKLIYEPGEGGELSAELEVPTNPGEHTKYVYIRTDEPKDRRKYELTIGARVKEYVRLEPRYLRWEHAARPDPETLAVKNVHDRPIHVVKVETTNPNWSARLETIKDGQEYKIHVSPPEKTTVSSHNSVMIKTDFPERDPYVFRVNTRVARKRKRPKTNWLLELFR